MDIAFHGDLECLNNGLTNLKIPFKWGEDYYCISTMQEGYGIRFYAQKHKIRICSRDRKWFRGMDKDKRILCERKAQDEIALLKMEIEKWMARNLDAENCKLCQEVKLRSEIQMTKQGLIKRKELTPQDIQREPKKSRVKSPFSLLEEKGKSGDDSEKHLNGFASPLASDLMDIKQTPDKSISERKSKSKNNNNKMKTNHNQNNHKNKNNKTPKKKDKKKAIKNDSEIKSTEKQDNEAERETSKNSYSSSKKQSSNSDSNSSVSGSSGNTRKKTYWSRVRSWL